MAQTRPDTKPEVRRTITIDKHMHKKAKPMFHPIESVRLIQRIIRLAQDEEPTGSAQTHITSPELADRFEDSIKSRAPSLKPQPPGHHWTRILWDFRKKVVLESQFIENFTNQVNVTINAIDQLPDFYRKGTELKSTQDKKDSIRNVLQNILDYLEQSQNKTIGDLGWAILKGSLDLNHILRCLSEPLIQLLFELKSENASENPLEKTQQNKLKKEAVQNLVDFFKIIPYAIPTYEEIDAFRKQPGHLVKTNEELILLYYYQHIENAFAKLSQSFTDLDFSKTTSEELMSVFIQPQRAMSIVIPHTISSIGQGIKESFNQVLIAHILQLAASLAPLCAPKKENLFPLCSTFTLEAIEKIAKRAPSLQHFLDELKSDYKQRKIKEDLDDIKKFLPPFYESLKKSPLGLSPSEGGQAMLHGEFKNQERFLGQKYEYALKIGLKKNQLTSFFLQFFCWVFKKPCPISQLQKLIEKLKTNKIDLFTFYNNLRTYQTPRWLQKFCNDLQIELGGENGYLDQKAKLLLKIGNENFFTIAQDNIRKELAAYKTLADSFNKSFWNSIVNIDTQLLQKWINYYLRIHYYQLSLSSQKISVEENIDQSIKIFDWLTVKIQKQCQLLEKLKLVISQINPNNSVRIHSLVAQIANIRQNEIPAFIQYFMGNSPSMFQELQKEEYAFSQAEPDMIKNYIKVELSQIKKKLAGNILWDDIATSYCFGFTEKDKENCKKTVAHFINQSKESSNNHSTIEEFDHMKKQLKVYSQLLENVTALNDDTYKAFLERYGRF